ncbi:hypothetical protein ACFSQ3_07120 [Sphingobacterium corticis]|uniref:Zinc finger CHC2-type domain-containing protein n=1 Tax=Sphingobacterium corticis TaxID=1812823 RepID=A0ABW5NII2_9SPHI
MDCKQAKQISMLDILNRQGFRASYTKNNKGVIYHWFISPFRPTETIASFSYNSRLNTFYDYGNGLSGTVVDYICAYYQFDIPKTLNFLREIDFSFSQHSNLNIISAEKKENKRTYNIKSIKSVAHPALVNYLARRKISKSLCKKYLLEIEYEIYGRSFFGVAFQNDSKGYEISYEYRKQNTGEFTRVKTCLICIRYDIIFNGKH